MWRRLTVLSGGPGTGKTSVVVRLLALLQELAEEQPLDNGGGQPLRLALAAPTGKAAARLTTAIRQSLEAPAELAGQANPSAVNSPIKRASLRVEAVTIHRLLGVIPGSVKFRHHAEQPLEADLIVIDEASMVPLPLMCRILAAVPPTARLILLGDMDQLASVEPGYVLGDLCQAARVAAFSQAFRQECLDCTGLTVPGDETVTGPLSDNCVRLSWSWRFRPGSQIDRVSRAVNAAGAAGSANPLQVSPLREAALAWSLPGILHPDAGPVSEASVHWKAVPERLRDAQRLPLPLLRDCLLARYRDYLQASTPEAALAAADKFRILCALKAGPHGVAELNRLVEEVLSLQFEADREQKRQRFGAPILPAHRGQHYDHRLIMITQNQYSQDLFNGDIGVILQPPVALDAATDTDKAAAPRLLAYFPARQAGAPCRSFPPERLPAHDTAFAMTVHKSQGSEFSDVLLVLPNQDSPVVSKELIYTGITRARHRVEIWLNPTLFALAAQRRTERYSGLADQLSQPVE